ncbi:MAG: RNA polymerase sigma factor [Acidobacteria bacterium]|nr:RNA polymerase sigma factor [Acidobacteriota bacterium]MCI0724495.1 RNA polymerase sigma factor [Acidobacteriota bacterium]
MGLVRLTDKDLAESVARGDGEAFNVLVGRWEQKLFNYALRLTSDREDAFDVCQDTFVKAYEQIGQLQNHDKFSHWLFKIARNFCISLYREKKNFPRLEPSAGSEDGTELENLLSEDLQVRIDHAQRYEPAELRLIVERALEHLSFEQRETVVLKVYEGLKFTEIAEIVNCPVSTVKSRLYLGLSELKKFLSRNERGAS